MNVSFLPSPLKRKVSSDLDSHDAQSNISSVFLAGNLDCFKQDFDDDDSEDEYLLDDAGIDELEAGQNDDENSVTLEDLAKAEKILQSVFGNFGILKSLIKAILSGKLDVGSDIAFQAIVYKLQSLLYGKHSLRYLENYGMFWAGVRNLIKSRGVVVFLEHFPVPQNSENKFLKSVDWSQKHLENLDYRGKMWSIGWIEKNKKVKVLYWESHLLLMERRLLFPHRAWKILVVWEIEKLSQKLIRSMKMKRML